MNLKPSFDMALTEGLNRLVWRISSQARPSRWAFQVEDISQAHIADTISMAGKRRARSRPIWTAGSS